MSFAVVEDVEVGSVREVFGVPSSTPIVAVWFGFEYLCTPPVVDMEVVVWEFPESFDSKYVVESVTVWREAVVNVDGIAEYKYVDNCGVAAVFVAKYIYELVGLGIIAVVIEWCI